MEIPVSKSPKMASITPSKRCRGLSSEEHQVAPPHQGLGLWQT
jgi:hypothetical protein